MIYITAYILTLVANSAMDRVFGSRIKWSDNALISIVAPLTLFILNRFIG